MEFKNNINNIATFNITELSKDNFKDLKEIKENQKKLFSKINKLEENIKLLGFNIRQLIKEFT